VILFASVWLEALALRPGLPPFGPSSMGAESGDIRPTFVNDPSSPRVEDARRTL